MRLEDKIAQEKTIAYGEALQKYRRGLITHDEMMAKCDKAEKECREALAQLKAFHFAA